MRLHSPPKWAPLSNNETTYRLTATLGTGLGARRTDSLKAGLGGDPLKVQDEGDDCPVPEHSDPDTEVPRWATNPFSLPPISAPPTPEHEGTNPCSVNNGDCSQLCLPTSESTRSCMCTAGYSLRSGQQACEGQYSRLGPGPQPQPVLPCSPTFLSSP